MISAKVDGLEQLRHRLETVKFELAEAMEIIEIMITTMNRSGILSDKDTQTFKLRGSYLWDII